MGLNQTSVLNQRVVEVGDAFVEYTLNDGGSYTGLGATDSIVFTETLTPLDGEPGNAVKPRRVDGIASQNVVSTFNLWESDPVKIAALRGGIDIVTQTAGGAVAGAEQTIVSGAWAYDIPVEITGQNADGTAPTINSVTGGTDGAIVVRTDYVLQQDNSTKKWSIVITDSTTITTLAQDMVIDYDYTPSAITTVTTGGIVPAGRIGIRATNKTVDTADANIASELSISEGDKYYYVHEVLLGYCIVNAGKAWAPKDKNDTNPTIITPMSLQAESDPDLPAGTDLMTDNYFNQVIS